MRPTSNLAKHFPLMGSRTSVRRLTLTLLGLGAPIALTACSALPPMWMVVQMRSKITDHQHFENAPIARSPLPSALPPAPKALRWPGGQSDAVHDAWHTENGTVALVVLHKGNVVFERYYNGYTRESLATSFSVAKSVVSALIGIAISDGRIRSMDESITKYLPELRSNDARFERITLAHLLRMRSGIEFDEGYSTPFTEAAQFYLSSDMKAQVAKLRIEREPNQAYKYSSGDTQLLAMALERAVGEPLASYAQRKLWQPMGAEFDASWSLDSKAGGQAKGFCCLNARAVDYARLGQLFLQGGEFNGLRIVPQDWVRQSTVPQQGLPGATQDAQRNIEKPASVWQAYYGLQWRIAPLPPASGVDLATPREPSKHFYAQGLHGQFVYVAPDEQTVVVRLGQRYGDVAWPRWMGNLVRANL